MSDTPSPAVPGPPRETRAAGQRERILAGLAEALAEKGYAATTIADIAASARVSRTTVYEQFAAKDLVLTALYEDLSDRIISVLARRLFSLDRAADWRANVASLIELYMEEMADASAGERLSLLEVASAGPRARIVRREVLDRYALAITWMSEVLSEDAPDAHALSIETALGIVGGVNELVLRAADDGPDGVRALRPVGAAMLIALMETPPRLG